MSSLAKPGPLNPSQSVHLFDSLKFDALRGWSILSPPYPHMASLALIPTRSIDLLPIFRISTLPRPTSHKSIPSPRPISLLINPNRIPWITRFNRREIFRFRFKHSSPYTWFLEVRP